MDPFRPAPRFDGTGFQRWKVLMQAHLQATGLNVWRVVSKGIKNNGQQEKQYDVTVLALLKYPFYPLFILDNGMNLISKSLTVLTPA